MTTIIPFLPSNLRVPRFKAALDGSIHEISVTWNISAQRYYINVYDANGVWILTTALVTTPPARNTAQASYDPFLGAVVVDLVDPQLWPTPISGPWIKPGTIVEYTLEGFQPNTYNGKYRCLHISPIRFTYPMPQDPGPLLILGRVSRLLNMVDTVFTASSLVYRNGAFEISP
jgi:hypothetical protein